MIRPLFLMVFILWSAVGMASEDAYQVTSLSGPIFLNMASDLSVGESITSESNLSSDNGDHFVMQLGNKSTVKTVACPVCLRNKVALASVSSGETILNLEHGGLLIQLNDANQTHQLKVKTPTAVASVRGTAFWMHVHHNGEETLGVHKGAVEVSRVGQYPSLIQAQEAVDLSPSESDFSRRKLSVFERDTILQVVNPL